MKKPEQTLPEKYFDDIYTNHDDPWKFETSPYEAEKYATTLSVLPAREFANAFEVGCSIGVLTRLLAAKCKKLLAVDASEKPLLRARQRLHDFPNVEIRQMTVPQQFPEEQFDLIIVSEVGYYLSLKDLELFLRKILQHLLPGGLLLLVHWTPFVPDYPLTGDEVHDFVLTHSGQGKKLKHLTNLRKENYRLDLFSANSN